MRLHNRRVHKPPTLYWIPPKSLGMMLGIGRSAVGLDIVLCARIAARGPRGRIYQRRYVPSDHGLPFSSDDPQNILKDKEHPAVHKICQTIELYHIFLI
jgi:hypothetical protein